MKKIPDVIARYSGHWILNDLLKERISVSKVTAFNDPFEGHVKKSENITPRQIENTKNRISTKLTDIHIMKGLSPFKAKEKTKLDLRKNTPHMRKVFNEGDTFFNGGWHHDTLDKTMRLACFVAPQEHSIYETPMWAYYADSHKGVRVHISKEVFGTGLKPIDYVKEPPIMEFAELHNPSNHAKLFQTICTKSEAWIHEKEIRFFMAIEVTKEEQDDSEPPVLRSYYPVQAQHIVRVDIGINATDSTINKAQELHTKFPHIEIYQAVKPSGIYYIEYQKIRSNRVTGQSSEL